MSVKHHLVYLPGMGADSRLYKNITVANTSSQYLDWISPDRMEDLSSYAQRMVASIQHPNPVLVGSSFGGVVALEMAKIIEVKHVVLLGAPSCLADFSMAVRLGLRLGAPFRSWVKFAPNRWVARALQVNSEEDRALFLKMLTEVPQEVIPFGVKALSVWRPEVMVGFVQIVGQHDWIVKQAKQGDVHVVQGAGHCVTLDRPDAVNKILSLIMKQL